MPDHMTPVELSKEIGVPAPTIRRWLRAQGWQSVPYSRWYLTPEQADAVRERFGR